MKTLLLARHAKSSWDQPVDDIDRPLNQRGQLDVTRMANCMQQCGYLVHQIISSDARRALATAEEYARFLKPKYDLIINHDLYLASSSQIVNMVRDISPQCSTVMLVGHNPGMTDTLNDLSHENIDNMPTCSVAVIQFEVSHWRDISAGQGDLLAFEHPGKLP